MACFLSLTFMLMEGVVCPPPPPPLTSFPAVVMVYDPALGGINCDSDCTTIATGPLLPEMYGTVAACHPDLLYKRILIPTIGEFDCLDTGGSIRVNYNEHFERDAIYFDILYDLVTEIPPWAGMLINNWEVIGWARN